jgi:hypothetical protein
VILQVFLDSLSQPDIEHLGAAGFQYSGLTLENWEQQDFNARVVVSSKCNILHFGVWLEHMYCTELS